MSLGHSQKRPEAGLMAGKISSHWCTWWIEWGAHTTFAGMLREQGNEVLKFTTQQLKRITCKRQWSSEDLKWLLWSAQCCLCVWSVPRWMQERQQWNWGASECSQYLTEMLLVVITIADWMSRLLITSEQLDWRKILSVITVNSLR